MENFSLNERLVIDLNHWANSSLFFTNLVIFGSVYLGWIILLALILYVYQSPRRWAVFRYVLISLFSALVCLILADLIKTFHPTLRPYLAISNIKALFTPLDQASFPSSHAAFFGAMSFSLWFRRRTIGWYFIFGAIIICFSRVAAGIHYPLDVISGLALGLLCAWLFSFWFKSHRH